MTTLLAFGTSLDSVKDAVKKHFAAEDKANVAAEARVTTLTEYVVYSFPSSAPSLEVYKAHRKALSLALAPLYTARRDDKDAKKGAADASRAISQCIEVAHEGQWFINPTPPRADKVVSDIAARADDAAKTAISAIRARLQVKGKTESEVNEGYASLIALGIFDPELSACFSSVRAQARKHDDAVTAKARADLEESILRKAIADGRVVLAS